MSFLLASLIASPRVMMGLLFLSAAIKLNPEYNDKVLMGDFTKPAWLFEAGSWCYTIATIMDGVPHFKSRDLVKIAIFFLYLMAGLYVLLGSLWFLPDVQERHPMEELGQGLFITAGTIMLAAVLCDVALLLYQGKKVILAQIVAILAIIPGAMLFTMATVMVYPKYLFPLHPVYLVPYPSTSAFEFASAFYVAASCFFILHALAYLVTVAQLLGASEGEPKDHKESATKDQEPAEVQVKKFDFAMDQASLASTFTA